MYQRMNRTWLAIALALSALLLAVHLYALANFWYWHYRWFDIPMHILGGIAIGSLLLSFGTNRRTSIYFLCMLAIVVCWEIFEYVFGISTHQPHYWVDTFKDMADGLLGSCAALYFARKTAWH